MIVQGAAPAQAMADLTARASEVEGPCQPMPLDLTATVCNRRLAPAPDGLPVEFSKGGAVLCRARTPAALAPGACLEVSCTWAAYDGGRHLVTVAADDDGTARGLVNECNEDNNRATMWVGCVP